MSSKLTVLGVVTALLISGSLAFVAVPSMAVANDGAGNDGAGDGAHEISECTIIDEPGEYTVTEDITNESAQACIVVDADDVTLDGNGHTIDGVDENGRGINVNGANVTVVDVTVTGFEYGVANFADLRLANSTLTENTVGLRMDMASASVVDNTISGNAEAGVDVDTSDEREVRFDGNEIVDNGGAGIQTFYSEVTVTDNRIAGNGDGGVVGDDTYVASTDNVIVENDGAGIATGLGGVNSTGDTIANNTGNGISTTGYANVDGSTIRENGEDGISLRVTSLMGQSSLSVVDTEIRDNGANGVDVEDGGGELTSASVDLSTIAGNGDDGVNVYTGENVEVHDSWIADNDGLGVNNTGDGVVNATYNYWGADDGPSSADDADAPFEDPQTGTLADGSGDAISENASQAGVSNVRFDPFLVNYPGEPGTPSDEVGETDYTISECREITESGTYELVDDIEADVGATDACIDVVASDVVIDGNGHTIDGLDGDGTGIHSGPSGNITIENVTVTGFDTGLENVMDDVTVLDSHFDGNGVGVSAATEDAELSVEGSSASNNDATGIAVDAGDATIVDSELRNNGDRGLGVFGPTEATIRDSLVTDNPTGIEVGDGTLVSEDNTIRNNSEVGITVIGELQSMDDVVEENGVGIRGGDRTVLTGTTVRNNTGHGVALLPGDPAPTFASITDSSIVDNGGDGVHVDADNSDLSEPISEFEAGMSGSVVAGNDGLGVNNTEPFIFNATGNDWGSDDGPSSADDPDAPFADPVTGALADGSGDEVSEHPEKPGVSNVHFTTEAPEDDEGEDGEQDGDDERDEDEHKDDERDERERDDEVAYQVDLATGEVIETLGDDENDFYGTQGRLLQAKSLTADGDLTRSHGVPQGMATADGLSYSAVSYDAETGEMTVEVSLAADAESDATVTLAAYELPGDTTEFQRDRADGQELVAHQTVTLSPGDSMTITIDVDE